MLRINIKLVKIIPIASPSIYFSKARYLLRSNLIYSQLFQNNNFGTPTYVHRFTMELYSLNCVCVGRA